MYSLDRLDESILMSKLHIFMLKYENFPKKSHNNCFLGQSKEFPRDSKSGLNHYKNTPIQIY